MKNVIKNLVVAVFVSLLAIPAADAAGGNFSRQDYKLTGSWRIVEEDGAHLWGGDSLAALLDA